MKRTLSLLLLAALLLAACANSAAVAATINGHDISTDDVTRGAHGFGESKLFREQLSQQGVELKATGTVPTAFAAQWLQSLITSEAIRQYAAKHHISPSDQESTEARQQFSGSSSSAQAFKQLPKFLQRQLVDTTALQLAVRSAVKPTVSDKKLAAAYQQLAADCPSKRLIGHILLPTADAAQQAIDRINGGEAFGAVAASVSTDTGSAAQGGLLMCQDSSQWSQLDQTFATAAEAVPLGKISAPVQTQFGFHVIEAIDLTPENAQPLVLAAVQANDPLAQVIGKFIKGSKITVNPRFGKLKRSGTSFTINPPTPKKVRSLPTTSTTAPPAAPVDRQHRHRVAVVERHEQHDRTRVAVTPARVVVVGLGPAGTDLMLPVARAAYERIPHRFVRTRRHPAVVELDDAGFAATSFDELLHHGRHLRRALPRDRRRGWWPRRVSTVRWCTRCRAIPASPSARCPCSGTRPGSISWSRCSPGCRSSTSRGCASAATRWPARTWSTRRTSRCRPRGDPDPCSSGTPRTGSCCPR